MSVDIVFRLKHDSDFRETRKQAIVFNLHAQLEPLISKLFYAPGSI